MPHCFMTRGQGRKMGNEDLTFDEWLAGLDLSFWGTVQQKVTPGQFFER
jgi:hypothetical protein